MTITLLPCKLKIGASVIQMYKALKKLDLHELDELSVRIGDDPETMARLLLPDRPENRCQIIELIGKWAIHQKLVLESTVTGMPHIAHVFEKVAQRIWQRLPEYARIIRVKIES